MAVQGLGLLISLACLTTAAGQSEFGDSGGGPSAQQCPAACVCGDETATVQCENQDLSQPPKVPAQTTSLRLAGNSFGDLATNAFDGLTRLQTLDLSSSGVRVLAEVHLRQMRSLRVLLLADNAIALLPDNAFQPVARSLEELDLSGNPEALTSAAHGSGLAAAASLQSLTALRSLRVSRCGLRDLAGLTERLAASAMSLEELVADGNQLTTLDAQTFATLARHERLRRVSIADNRIRSIRPGSFDHLSSIEGLDISGNAMAAADLNRTLAEMGALLKLRRLALARMNISRLSGLLDMPIAQRLLSLDLSGNLIGDVGNRRFYSMISLQVLDLSANQIKTLESGSFSGLSSLTQLSLAGNRLHTVTARALENLQALTVLDLSRNQLTSLDLSAFVDLFKLVRLDVSHNYIAAVRPDESGGSLEMLRELCLAGNLLNGRSLAELLAAVTGLRSLDVSRNRIDLLPGNLLPARSALATLNLSSNVIADLSGSSGSPFAIAELRLQSLDLSHNRLERMPAWPRSGGSLIAMLSLRGNSIAALTARSLAALGQLRELDVGENKLHTIDAAALAGSPGLRKLRLDGNDLGPFIAGLASDGLGASASALAGGRAESPLEELDLSRNDASALADGLFANLTHLRSLNLSGNRLAHIASRQLRGPDLSLALVDLSANNLTRGVDPGAFARLATLGAVDLSRNPFDCRDPCRTQAFRRWADSGNLAADRQGAAATALDSSAGRAVRVLGYRVRGRYVCSAATSDGGSGGSGGVQWRAGAPLHALPARSPHACPSADGQAEGEAGYGSGGSGEKTIILVVIGCTAFVVLVVAVVVFWQHRVRLRRKLHKQRHFRVALDHNHPSDASAPVGLGAKSSAASAAVPVGAYKYPPSPMPPPLHGDGWAMHQHQHQPLLAPPPHGQPWCRADAMCMTQTGSCGSGHARAAGLKCGTAYV